MSLLLGGRGSLLAIDWNGRALTYQQLDAAIDRWPQSRMHDASELDLPEALICVFAAARQGAAVRVENPEARPVHGNVDPDAFLLVATSGSTGRPRGLARTAASWTDSFAEFTSITGITAADRVLVTGPLHATMHLFAAAHALWIGACVTDDRTSATVAHAVPAVLRDLLDRAPALRLAVVAGTALDAGAQERAHGIELVEYYGAAELSLVAARRVPEPLTLLAGLEAEVRDGLLFVRSPYRVLGAPEWFGVGDLAELGPNRQLIVRGRGDAAVNVGGTTVIAEDVELVLDSIDGVRASAVVGTPHSVLGATVTAVVELHDGADVDSVKAEARGRLFREAVPRRWIVVPALPRTGSGKIARARVTDSIS
ncbi:class I adenylate-forming enzyme family protein [Rhodococcus sp. 1168]|uniref:class I adenylate-forming enzyme family protein n=1 Tax=Rhodococcus sp. 1168 TaxID=2018041 RepID=UPI000A0E7072|nr:AMP-binding protein [Rhodococcus sp. 1168]ORI23933.1 synthetase [Rhodococcus sp. 1168]